MYEIEIAFSTKEKAQAFLKLLVANEYYIVELHDEVFGGKVLGYLVRAKEAVEKK